MDKYYKILGVERGSTPNEIKTAYRKLSKKYHPDVNPDNPEAENKFKEITEAYEILSGKQKPKQPHYGNRRVFKAKPIRMVLNLTLEEVYHGTTKKVHYTVNEICSDCDGEGGFEPQTCNHCGGHGYVRQGPFAMMCNNCGGSGKIFKKVCYTCRGSGYTKLRTHVDLDIPKGVTEHTILSYPGVGDFIKDGERGDVHFITQIQPHPIYQLEGLHLRRKLDVSIIDILLGSEKEMDTLDGRVKIKIPRLSELNKTFRLRGKGLTDNSIHVQGDLYVTLNPITPKELTESEEKILSQLKDSPNFNN